MSDNINQRISTLIEDLKLTPNAFASQLGIKTTIIYNIQKGRNKPSFDLLQKIAQRFNVNAQWLLLGNSERINSNELKNEQMLYNSNDTVIYQSHDTVNNKNDKKSYMRAAIEETKENAAKQLNNYYNTDPIGIKSKMFRDLKEKYARRLEREFVKEDKGLFELSRLVENLGDLIDLLSDVYSKNINCRPDPFEITQYFDFQTNTDNIPDTITYESYKESVIKWLAGAKRYEQIIKEFYKESEVFLERLNNLNSDKKETSM